VNTLIFSIKNMSIGVLLVCALCLSTWSIFITQQSTPKTTEINFNRPDMFMEQVIATIINKEGKPTLKVVTPKMIHYAQSDSTDITTPMITVFRKDSPKPWTINANFAKATDGITQILFWDNVTIFHPSDENNPTTTMKTDTLTVFPQKQTAETDKAILITQPTSTIHAIGMQANLNDGTVKLLSQATEEYAPIAE
jgi:lipopolysaccharide export system protein LptC